MTWLWPGWFALSLPLYASGYHASLACFGWRDGVGVRYEPELTHCFRAGVAVEQPAGLIPELPPVGVSRGLDRDPRFGGDPNHRFVEVCYQIRASRPRKPGTAPPHSRRHRTALGREARVAIGERAGVIPATLRPRVEALVAHDLSTPDKLASASSKACVPLRPWPWAWRAM